jgi:hypothetical protein
MKEVDTELIAHWQQIRATAIEMALTAERNLIAVGAMKEADRRVFTRDESRAKQAACKTR